ncbi:peptidoglycan D,D-transpeptidase FtsI family protein [Inconstantimicrobium mannanitabidum]|uniref:Penicillin-binding protein n=1 Tax=Inconstantimicrobium mannanitabidum TaxID=1604901 RepID=A0ACB5R823_9CLOT|nr:penicillin-binding transpeptidase domain-containing protein [Clostridium sp. TW13]GKX65116.1 penicillin-binding protein [Clostridium sp. TW13]
MKKKKNKIDTRYKLLVLFMIMIIGIIIMRLLYIQVYKYDEYKDRANIQSRRFISEKAPRGKIYDSSGSLLATNKQTYNISFDETTEAKKTIFKTLNNVMKLLDENGEKQDDKFGIKINEKGEFYFDFYTSDKSVSSAKEIRFKKDRGFYETVKKQLYGKTDIELNEVQEAAINEKLLSISAKDCFYKLLKDYEFYKMYVTDSDKLKEYASKPESEIANELLSKNSVNDLRKVMIVLDAIKMQSFSGFKSVTIASNVKRDTAFIFNQKISSLPGINVKIEPMRVYPNNELASGVLGYLSSIDSTKSSRYEEKGYDISSDLIGVSGIEGAFESVLRGSTGGSIVKVNSQGRKAEELFTLEPGPGNNVHLTIDKNLQYSAETMLRHQLEYLQKGYSESGIDTRNATRAAVVATEVKTGRILAMVSYPGYDANLFSNPKGITTELSNKYFSPNLDEFGNQYINNRGLGISLDELFPKNSSGVREDKYDVVPKPFYNYATQGLIPPGSTFKPMTSVAALEQGVVGLNETMVDRTEFNTHPETFGSSFAPKDNAYHGVVNIRKALAVSCNYFYYESAYRMYMKNGANTKALNTIAEYAWKAGLGVNPNSDAVASTGIEIPEKFGKTYSFEDFRAQNTLYAKFDLVDFLGKGNYNNTYYFAPLDIAYNGSDSEKVKNIKKDIKSVIEEKLKTVGDKSITDGLEQLKTKIKSLVSELEQNSDVYKKNISDFNSRSSHKNSPDLVANAVEAYLYSKNTSIKTPAEIINAAIGQGINNFTPLQLSMYISTIVNGGTRYKAHLVDKITDYQGKVIDEFKPEVLDRIQMKQTTLDAIKDGMEMANTADMGTASSVFKTFPISSGGKTGTATFREDEKKYGREAYGVYVSFAPKDDPQVAVTVVIYDGAHGYLGSPVARAIYETYFRDKLKKENPNYKPVYMDTQEYYDFTLNPPLEAQKDKIP